MKVMLLQDVAQVGSRFSVVDVKDGYATNFLLPQKLARPATDQVLKEVKARKVKLDEGVVARHKALQDMFTQLGDGACELFVKVNEKGHLFAAVKSQDIVDALKKEKKVEIDQSLVHIQKPIKEVGEYEVTLGEGERTKKLKVKVVAQK